MVEEQPDQLQSHVAPSVRLLERPRRVQGIVVEPDRFGDVLLRRREAGQLQVDVAIFGLGFPQRHEDAAGALRYRV